MNTKKITQAGKSITTMIALQLITLVAFAQAQFTGNTIDLTVSGTSTLHDWDMKSVKAECNAAFAFNAAGQITGLTALSFSTPATALKSEHTSMDNNAYKALKVDKSPAITYTMTSVTITPSAGGASTVKCTGRLTIAGTTVNEDVEAICKPNGDNTISVSGSKPVSMKAFNMVPPTFMLGTIKTGNDVVLKFKLILKKA